MRNGACTGNKIRIISRVKYVLLICVKIRKRVCTVLFICFVSVIMINNFAFQYTNKTQVEALLLKINSRKSCGYDGIPPRLVKESANAIAGPIAAIMNHSIRTGQYPSRLKLGQVTPLFKKDDELNKSNYRKTAGKLYAWTLARGKSVKEVLTYLSLSQDFFLSFSSSPFLAKKGMYKSLSLPSGVDSALRSCVTKREK